MSGKSTQDWNPGSYERFRGLRLRPALDLLGQVGRLPLGDVVDLGCGAGAVARSLSERWPARALIGVDNSPAMLAKARETGRYTQLVEADVASWRPEARVAVIFSNALCHWLPDHQLLFRRLAGLLHPGGTLAVQMPRQYAAPSHALLRQIAAEMFPDRFDFTDWQAPVAAPEAYAEMLAPLGALNIWQTTYFQRLAAEARHPVAAFTRSTAQRPFLAQLGEREQAAFAAAYEAALHTAYPLAADGTVLFAFQRLFFTLTLPTL